MSRDCGKQASRQYKECIPGFDIGTPELKSLFIQILHYEYNMFITFENFDRIHY